MLCRVSVLESYLVSGYSSIWILPLVLSLKALASHWVTATTYFLTFNKLNLYSSPSTIWELRFGLPIVLDLDTFPITMITLWPNTWSHAWLVSGAYQTNWPSYDTCGYAARDKLWACTFSVSFHSGGRHALSAFPCIFCQLPHAVVPSCGVDVYSLDAWCTQGDAHCSIRTQGLANLQESSEGAKIGGT